MTLNRVLLLLGTLLVPASAGAETCRFTGTASHDGHLDVTTDVTEAGGAVTVDVILRFTASALLSDVQYLTEEISTWRGNEVQSLAANYRTVVDGRIRRQQWDVWTRAGGALQARRVQATTLEEFERHHPGFVRHWALAGFGAAWLPDYATAAPDRRPDLDVSGRALAAGLRPALAMAFYWSRYLPADGGAVPVFLPGFKHDARVDLAVAPATPGPGWRRWSVPLHHPALDAGLAAAWVSPDGYLLQLGADVRSGLGSGQALVRAAGCQGVQIPPSR